ncbi:MAG: helix-hairpin-helix domain-containing protein [Chitinophagaceae bacterium]
MKEAFRALFRFSRIERLGIIALSFLILIIVIANLFLRQWLKPDAPNAARLAAMQSDYNAWLSQQETNNPDFTNALNAPSGAASQLFPFDPNTLDSAGFVQLGMPPKAIKGLLNWRSKGKHFYQAKDLKPLYNLPEEVFTRIEPFVRIAATESDNRFAKSNSFSREPIPDFIELNTADSALLDRAINGVGAVLAHKIVARRTALGGYLKHEQLLEVYKFSDTTFTKIKARLHLDASKVRKISLNTATLEQLSNHPYIGEKIAKNILLYREGIKNYQSVGQLREVPLMTEENYRKIAPYCSVE